MNLRCIKHPGYKGHKRSPELTCRACCAIFIDSLKRERKRKAAQRETEIRRG